MTELARLLKLAADAGCTPAQLEALELRQRGFGRRRMARILGISPQAAADRLDGAERRITRYIEEAA